MGKTCYTCELFHTNCEQRGFIQHVANVSSRILWKGICIEQLGDRTHATYTIPDYFDPKIKIRLVLITLEINGFSPILCCTSRSNSWTKTRLFVLYFHDKGSWPVWLNGRAREGIASAKSLCRLNQHLVYIPFVYYWSLIIYTQTSIYLYV